MAKKAVPTKKKAKRKHIRFAPDSGTLAYILTDGDGQKLKPPLPALVIEESFAGCSFVVIKNSQFHEDAEFQVQVGKLSPMKATIRWMKSFDEKVSIIGLSYKE